MHAAILNNFISSYFSDAVLGATPLIVTEYGRYMAPHSSDCCAQTCYTAQHKCRDGSICYLLQHLLHHVMFGFVQVRQPILLQSGDCLFHRTLDDLCLCGNTVIQRVQSARTHFTKCHISVDAAHLHRPSSSPYTPAIQADVVQVESSTFKTMATGSQYPRFLGSCVFVYSDSSFGGRQMMLLIACP